MGSGGNGDIPPSLLGSGLSIALDFTPVVGDVKGAVEALTGRDIITGEQLAPWERIIGIIPYIDVLSNASKTAETLSRIADAAGEASDAAKIAAAAGNATKAAGAAQQATEASKFAQEAKKIIEATGDLEETAKASAIAGDVHQAAQEATNAALQATRGTTVRPYQNLYPKDVATPVTRHELFFDGNKWRYKTPSGQVYTPNGEYNFITQGDKIYIARERLGRGQHINISRGEDVDFAGQIRFGHGTNSRGQIQYWNNASGHYKPAPESVGNANLPSEAFQPYNFLQ